MASLFKNLLGNGTDDRELASELRALLQSIQQERARSEALLGNVRAATDRLETLGEPIAKAGSDVDAVTEQLTGVQRRLEGVSKLAELVESLDERSTRLAQSQQQAEAQITEAVEGTQQIRTVFEELSQKVDLGVSLKERLEAFMEIEKPFQQLRNEAEALRGQVEGTGDHLARLREQHDRLIDAHKTAVSKMEALDRRRDDLGRSLQDKERRVAGVEEAVRSVDGVRHSIDDVRREIGSLKAMADLVAQKSAALEAQREAVDRALAQSENLDRAMRQIDAGVRQQQDNEKLLGTLQDQIAGVRAIHETVIERSTVVSQLQREADEGIAAARQELAAVTDETRKTVERFDFERRGMETVTQRVADLRASLADCESRFKALDPASLAVGQLTAQTQALATRLQALAAEAERVDGEMAKLQGIRRELDETGRSASEIGAQLAKLAEAQPLAEAAIRDLEQLRGAHAQVHDTLEQTRLAHEEIARVRDSQSETRSWLAGVEQTAGELRVRVTELTAMAPTIEHVQGQTQRIGESMASIESRRQGFEDLQRRMSDLEGLGGQLDDRGRQLQARMEAAEKRFLGLESHAEEAERMITTVATVSSGLNAAGLEADAIRKAVDAIAARAESVEGLAERTQALKKELDQRKNALAEASKDLHKASVLRDEAATYAGQLDDTTKELATALTRADQRVKRVDELSTQLEDRTGRLQSVEKRLNAFEERLARWKQVDLDVSRSLEEIATRQDTVLAMQADLDRMYAVAEKTANDVREIVSTHVEVEGSRQLLEEVMARLQEIRDTTSALDDRKRQMAKAEERLARAEGLLVDVQSSLEALHGQKALVDQAVEKTGSLQYLLRQTEAAIEGLRSERKTMTIVRSAVDVARQEHGDDDEEMAKAA